MVKFGNKRQKRMKNRYIAFFAIMFLAFACQKAENDLGNRIKLYAVGADSETKTVLLEDGSILWMPQDQIMVGYKGQAYKFVSTNASAAPTAEFEGSLGNARREEGEYLQAFYPYSAVSDYSDEGAVITLPAVQQGVDGSFADDFFPSAAMSRDNNLYFRNICGGIKFSLAVDGIKKVVFSGNNEESLAGTFKVQVYSVNGTPSVLSFVSSERKVTLKAPAGGTFKKGEWYYLALVPRPLRKGYTIEFYADNLVGTIVSEKDVTVKPATWGILQNLVPGEEDPPVQMEAVDLGLSVPWANINLGAKALNDYGDYFSWGEIRPAKGTYTWNNYAWGSPSKGFSKYTPDGKTVLDPEDDAATQILGDKWRMATIEEFTELYDNCRWDKTQIDGVVVYKVTGPNGNFIYFPAYPGYYDGNITERGVNGYYWSSTLLVSDWKWAQNLWFKNGILIQTGKRYFGEVIRPVYGDRPEPDKPQALLRSVPNTLDFGTVTVGSSATRDLQVVNEGNAGTLIDWNIPSGFSVSPSSSVYINPGETKDFTVTFSPAEAKDYSSYMTVGFDGGVSFVVLTAVGEASSTPSVPEMVDLGLSVKWASFNLGAAKPEEAGDYYAWGETETKDEYSWDTYGKLMDIPHMALLKYNNMKDMNNPDITVVDNKTILDPEDDAAHEKWGDLWRIPTYQEWKELLDGCKWTASEKNGVSGYYVSGKKSGYTNNKIFLPNVGRNSGGCFWSSSLFTDNSYRAWYFSLKELTLYDYYRFAGRSIRPVYGDRPHEEEPKPQLSVNPSSLEFGTVFLGQSAQKTFTVSNTGDAGTTVNLSVTNYSYSVSPGPAVEVGAKQSREITVTFTPSGEYAFTGEVVLQYAEGDNLSVGISGRGWKSSWANPNYPVAEIVDLGLSVDWASFNMGASAPEDNGGFYAWGETDEKTAYLWSSYKWSGNDNKSLTKYCYNSAYGRVDNKTQLDPEDDIAHVKWGGNWRMPTDAELMELLDKCSWSTVTLNGVKGCRVTGPSGNSIFLPFTGVQCEIEEGRTSHANIGKEVSYRSSTLTSDLISNSTPDNAFAIHIYSDRQYYSDTPRYYGMPVRAVHEKQTGKPSLSVTPSSLDFERVEVGKTASLTVSVTNTGTADTIIHLSISQDFTLSSSSSVVLGVGKSTTVTVAFSPAQVVSYTGSLLIKYEGGDPINVSLFGKGEEPASGGGPDPVDLGLSVKWAPYNVGASTPEDYGDYFAWGETSPKDSYTWGTYKWCTNGNREKLTKYNADSSHYGTLDNKSTLELEDDAAHVNWGGKWRMPTSAEMEDLVVNSTWEWVVVGNRKVLKVTSKKNGNSIIMPAGGSMYENRVYKPDVYGKYWTSSLGTDLPYNARYLDFYSSVFYQFYDTRFFGFLVRPVYDDKL